ncbi:MAG: hypothetical protein Q9219_000067 [cf. Caloplaca sp. 3 TL-2023]
MSLLGRLPDTTRRAQSTKSWPSEHSMKRLVRWLVSRQTSLLREADDTVPTENGYESSIEIEIASCVPPEYFVPDEFDIEPWGDELQFAGLTGRCNKPADTCYTFWAGGSLALLDSLHLVDLDALRDYLFNKTQHQIGGFGKLPGDPPGKSSHVEHCAPTGDPLYRLLIEIDVMHSCLGLAGLAGMGEPDLKPFDPSLCISLEARQRLESLPFRYSANGA